jgi:hypothetical protein
MKIIIQIVLWILIVFLGYQLYNSVSGPLKFNEIKEERYQKVISSLKDIKSAQLAHKEIVGKFSGNFDSLVRFIDTAQFARTVRRDTSYADVEKNKAFGLDGQTGGYILEAIIIDTLGFTAVKDSLYGGVAERYRNMMNVPVEGSTAKFDLQAGRLDKNDITYEVFEAKVSKDVILGDLDSDLLMQEKQVVSVEGVNGTHIKVGSMTDVNTSGNWPKLYDSAKEQ